MAAAPRSSAYHRKPLNDAVILSFSLSNFVICPGAKTVFEKIWQNFKLIQQHKGIGIGKRHLQ
jgi:hypothetical protein